MMDFEIDMSQFHESFFEEAFEAVAVMETELLALNAQGCDIETINTIFRAAHSIKGSASTFGFEAIGQFTHRVETLLDRLRNHELSVSQPLISLLLASVDCLKTMLSNEKIGAAQDEATTTSIAAQLEITSHANDHTEAEVDEQADSTAAPVQAQNAAPDTQIVERWNIEFKPDSKIFYSGNDPLRIIKELQTLGDIKVETITEDLAAFADLDMHDCYLAWKITLNTSATQEQIEEVFAWVEDECELRITRDNPQTSTDERRRDQRLEGRRRTDASQRSMRVNTGKVDRLLNLVGELVITQSILNGLCRPQDAEISERLEAVLDQLERNTRDLQEQTMSIRMLPVESAFQRLPRIVHDIGIAQGKQVAIEFSGGATELDKNVLENIGDPLIHLVRNAIDHGIEQPERRAAAGKPEQGTIHVKAMHKGGHVVIQISDDGNGIDPEKLLARAIDKNIVSADSQLSDDEIINLVFHPGLSTAEVINDISGRGVGMDVVRQNIMNLGGSVDIQSQRGAGCCFTITLPLTLSIMDGQIVKVGGQTFIIPLHSITETLVFDVANVKTISESAELYQYREQYIPVIRLKQVFNIDTDIARSGEAISGNADELLVIFDTGDSRAGIIVDDVIGQQQIVIKSLEQNYRNVACLTGATILGDGSVALIIDVLSLYSGCKQATAQLDIADSATV